MAQKRMFDKTITNSDDFLDLPDSSQVLYFHLNMNADDDGFVNNWKSIIRMTGTKEDDLKLLIAKSFVIPFESGVVVIKHWRINNYLRNDRYKETNYKDELKMLKTTENGEYLLKNNLGIPNGYQVDTQYRIEESSIVENRIEESSSSIEENIYDYYQNEIGTLTPRQYEILNNYCNDIPEELIKIAINKTSDSGANNFRYMESILKEWKQKGYKAIGDVENEIKNNGDEDYWDE